MKALAFIQKGNRKYTSEDRALINGNILKEGSFLFTHLMSPTVIAIADGVGGNDGGDEAACFLMDQLNALEILDKLSVDGVRKKLIEINDTLLNHAKNIAGKEQMAATLSGIIRFRDTALVFHVGNTRIYGIQGNYLKQLTHDHTTVQMLKDRGDTFGANFAANNEIIACMGGGNPAFCNVLQVFCLERFDSFGGFVFTSDGIHDHVLVDELEEKLLNCNSVDGLEFLCRIAEINGSADDKTILMIQR